MSINIDFVKENERQDFNKLLQIIQNYCNKEFDYDLELSDDEDLSALGLMYSTYDLLTDDDYYEEYIALNNLSSEDDLIYEVQVNLNLYTKELSVYYDDVLVAKEKFNTYFDLAKDLDGCDFDMLYSYYHNDDYLQKMLLKMKYTDIKDRYPIGTEIALHSSDYENISIPYGTKGTILAINDKEQLLVEWENGIQSYIAEDYDNFEILHYLETERSIQTSEINI